MSRAAATEPAVKPAPAAATPPPDRPNDREGSPPVIVGEPTETVTSVPVDIRSISLTILAVIAVVLVLQYAQPMLIPIVLGVLISYALDPIVTLLEKVKLPRPL
jgi:hypothetical protein